MANQVFDNWIWDYLNWGEATYSKLLPIKMLMHFWKYIAAANKIDRFRKCWLPVLGMVTNINENYSEYKANYPQFIVFWCVAQGYQGKLGSLKKRQTPAIKQELHFLRI